MRTLKDANLELGHQAWLLTQGEQEKPLSAFLC